MYTHVYTYICIYTHICVYVCIYIYMYICIERERFIHILTYIDIYASATMLWSASCRHGPSSTVRAIAPHTSGHAVESTACR